MGIRAHDGIDRAPIRVIDSQQIAEAGIDSAVAHGLNPLVKKDLPLWLNFDVDVLDPEWMPVTFPEPGGLSMDDVGKTIRHVISTGQAIGMSVTCFHPNLDPEGKSTARLVELIAEALIPLAQIE